MELNLRAQGLSLVRLHGLMFPFHLGAWNGGPEPPQQGPHLPVRLFPTSLFCRVRQAARELLESVWAKPSCTNLSSSQS